MSSSAELEQFRSRWQQEVASRRLRPTPLRAEAQADQKRRSPPAAAQVDQQEQSQSHNPDTSTNSSIGKATLPKDRLGRLLDQLVPAHEAAALENVGQKLLQLQLDDAKEMHANQAPSTSNSIAQSYPDGAIPAVDRALDQTWSWDDADAQTTRTAIRNASELANDVSQPPSPTTFQQDSQLGTSPQAESSFARHPTLSPERSVSSPTRSTSPSILERPIQTVYNMYAADEQAAFPLGQVPDEVLVSILLHLVQPVRAPAATPRTSDQTSYRPPSHTWRAFTGPDYISLEACARVCWKLRLLTSHPQLWRSIVYHTYQPPQIASQTALPSLLMEHQPSWRDLFIYQPRLRLHGTYIASCQYTQQGMSEENVWVRVLHVVKFYRYLRFFPEGQCISMLTTDPPQDVVHLLHPGVHAKGLTVGRWHLLSDKHDATVVLEDLLDPSLPNYRFQMTLHLLPSPGRWHKLELVQHASLNLATSEILPFPRQQHQRPFYFSRVISYGV
ncbi:hypothetical protein MPSI1_000009 [Malassezia psittaci]|uniref:F-box protein Hrt3/FBXO9 C-terminal domain-containing protein n=1 Tax=Malassezia psittaci TaxID=1821823 RepID=A0AAF0JCB1_9BASI|nr:hypothetical protein MPSI1_000009 [Malassezia psittaci]